MLILFVHYFILQSSMNLIDCDDLWIRRKVIWSFLFECFFKFQILCIEIMFPSSEYLVKIYDHVFPWIEPTLGIPIDPKPVRKNRKKTTVAKHQKVEKTRVRLNKLTRVRERRLEKMNKMLRSITDFEKFLWFCENR